MTWFLLAVLLWLPMSMGASAQPDDTSELVAGNSAFAFDLYGALIEHADGNLIVSPYSISQALAMTFAGAGGETATQMADTLSFTLPQPSLHDAFGALNTDLVDRVYAEDDPDVVQTARGLRIANALWGEQTYPFNPEYSALIEQDYGAGLQQTDFINAPEDARDEINGWVAEQTEDHIQDIVPEDAIGPDTRLVLANAIWFSGGWYLPFDPDATEDGEFTLIDGATVTVPFMFTHSHLSYGRGEGFQAIELDYAGSEFTFTIILPDDGQFETFESTMDAAALDTAIGQLSYTEVLVYLPKFAFAFDAKLGPTLQAMGVTDAFNSDLADFTGMVEGTPPEPLYIGEVLHKAFITVDENGTEAAAATVVEMAAGSAQPDEAPPEVRIDRPFIFVIRDSQTGTVLFLGRVMDPSAGTVS